MRRRQSELARRTCREIRRTGRIDVLRDQLELDLGDARLRIPWGGLSPRSLTRGGKLFIHPYATCCDSFAIS